MVRYKEKSGRDLEQEALDLGVSLDETVSSSGLRSIPLLQERVRAAKMARWARNSWVIALVSGLASLVSAVAAWLAVLQSK
jgi:hypothetical protein